MATSNLVANCDCNSKYVGLKTRSELQNSDMILNTFEIMYESSSSRYYTNSLDIYYAI